LHSFIELYLAPDDPRAPDAGAFIEPGTLVAVAPGHGIPTHRNADDRIDTYVAVNRLEGWVTVDVLTATADVAALFDD
jgi:hypothetical protein